MPSSILAREVCKRAIASALALTCVGCFAGAHLALAEDKQPRAEPSAQVARAPQGRDQGPRTAPPLGTWEVECVFVDSRAGNTGREALPDDPSLVGRALVVQKTDLNFLHSGWRHCKQKSWTPLSMTWGQLFAEGMYDRNGQDATPEVYGAPVRATDHVTVFEICSQEVPRKGRLNGPWIAIDGRGHLVMPETGQTLMFLKRRPDKPAIAPSFPCKNARSQTEKAICFDVDLASLDRSIAAAFELTREAWPNRDEALCAQRRWLARRDQSCKGDIECLKEVMLNRVGHLVQIVLLSGPVDSEDVEDGESCK